MTIRVPVQPLTWKLPPHRREPAVGYAARLANLNGVDFVTLMRDAGISAHNVHSGHQSAVRDVARLGGLDCAAAEALAWCTPRRATRDTLGRLGAETLGWRMVLARSFRFCPHCVAQDLADSPSDIPMAARPWLRFEWMIEAVRSCRTHAVFLAETQRTESELPDFSKVIAREVLPRLEQLRDATRHVDPSAFEDWILHRLDGVVDPANWLDSMPLHAALATCAALGVETLQERRRVSDLRAAEWFSACLAGFRIAREGEAAIERFLDALVLRSQAAGHIGMKSAYGQVLIVLERTLDDTSLARFREVVRRHAIENVPLPAGSQILGEVLERRRLHTLQSAAAASGTSRPTLRAIFARSGILPALAEPNHPRLTVRVDEFEAQLRDFASGLKIAEVVATTGIPQKYVLELVSRGMIPTLFASREVSRARHRVSRTSIETFMERLFEGAVPVRQPGSRQVTLGRACYVASTNIGDLIGLILDRRLSWKGCLDGNRRYGDLLVDAGEVTKVLQQAGQPRQSMTKREIHAAVPGLNRRVVSALIRTERMAVIKEFCPTTRRKLLLVTRESFEAFNHRYVTATEVAERHAMAPMMVIRLLGEAGRSPVFDPSEVQGWIYDRNNVEGFPWSDERPKPVRKPPLNQRAAEAQCIGPGAAVA